MSNIFMQSDFSDNDEIGIDLDNFNIEEELKLFEDCTIKPTDILIRLYIQPKKTKGGIIIDNTKDIFHEIVGYVAKIGKCGFSGERYKDWGNWYKVGDWVAFPRHAGIRYTYKKLPVFSIVDDAPMMVIPDPRYVK
jgi:co-chaperonin GroES (HSP10)